MRLPRALLGLLCGASLASAEARADSVARRLAEGAFERGVAQEERGDIALSLTSFDEAVRDDPTFGAALMRLGELRERLGDRDEAELLYTRAAAAPETGADALEARARLRSGEGRALEAAQDLARAAELAPTPERLRKLAKLYTDARRWSAALSVWRALLADATERGDDGALREARVTVGALSWLAGETDPVLDGATSPSRVRRSLARLARNAARDAAAPAQGARKLTP